MKIGRYGIAFAGRTFWMQPLVPATVRRFLWFLIIKEARPQDVHREKQFPLGMPMEYKGRSYRYYKTGNNQRTDEAVEKDK